ncbi:hypothetical protein DENSPDRAFT_669810 [Dentipellis sp. KUC8613]|nr:hypothetical protein DENSPDRAFT_669810 [Dentipellis sp. KUC8613]
MRASLSSFESSDSLSISVGAIYGCLLAMAFLYGTTTMQSLTYFRMYPEDRLLHKLTVAILWIVDTTNSVLIAYGIYRCLLVVIKETLFTIYSKPFPRTLVTTIVLATISDAIVRGFYWMRIWKLSKGSQTITGIIILLSLPPIGAGFYLAAKFYRLPALLNISDTSDAVYFVLESICAADCAISIVMMMLLWDMHTSMKKPTTFINTLIILVLTSGLITSVFAIVILITSAAGQIFICIGLYLMFSKFYINSLLTTFNNRVPSRQYRNQLNVKYTFKIHHIHQAQLHG